MSRVSRRLGIFVFLIALGGLLVPGAVAGAGQSPTVVADGLHSPRDLTFGPGGILYVAQAGDATAGSAISQIRNAMSSTPKARSLIEDLPSLGFEGEYIGVDGISMSGYGANSSLYAIVGAAPQMTGSDAFGQLLSIDWSGNATAVADVGRFDFDWGKAHPDLWEEFIAGDANPYDVLAVPGHVYVVDAGTNTLDEVMPDGSIEILAFFPNETIRDAVPTCAAQGPDGALYVGTLALEDSFAFGPSGKVWRVDPSQADLAHPESTPMSLWTSGLWPINGCTFGPNGDFYASELFTNPDLANPAGDVVRIPWSDPTARVSVTGATLSFAGGVAVAPNGSVFVSDGTAFVAPGSGRVLRFDQ